MLIGRLSKVITPMFLLIFSLTGCAGILDGPFNQDGVMVPELLYANNNSGYVTFWDDETGSYRTYNQMSNTYMDTVAFNSVDAQTQERSRDRISGSPVRLVAGGGSRNYEIAGATVMPLTQLHPDEMDIQSEQGCSACHKT